MFNNYNAILWQVALNILNEQNSEPVIIEGPHGETLFYANGKWQEKSFAVIQDIPTIKITDLFK